VKHEEESPPRNQYSGAEKAIRAPAIYSSPVEDECSDLAVGRGTGENDVPYSFTISFEAEFADADSRAANARVIEVAIGGRT
jgi:hypothetical protein